MAWDLPEDKSSREGFYVLPECCLSCGVPAEVAPDIFHMAQHSCFVRKQPETPEEIDRAIDAMMQTEVDCIRYGGNAEAVLKRLGQAEMPYRADDPDAYSHKPLVNNIVRFVTDPASKAHSAADWARRFSDSLQRRGGYQIKSSFFHRTVKFSWYGPTFHSVRFRAGGAPDEWIATAYPNPAIGIRGITRILRDWLASETDVRGAAWHTAETLSAGEAGMPTPY